MKINVKLSKNFQTQLNRLNEKYGEDFAKLNGLSESDLDFTDFIDNFVDEDTVADASVDGNANVGQKDIATMINEMPKAHQKLLAFNKLYYEMQKKYGFKEANKWLELEWTKALGMHDAHSSTEIPYCYKGTEMLNVKYNGEEYYISFQHLYNLLTEEEEFDESIRQVAKFPKDLYVLDIVNENIVYTQVKRVVKHSNDKKMRFIKYANGLSQIVTEDHPIITFDGDKPAKDVTTEDTVFTVEPIFFSNTIKSITSTHKPHSSYKDVGTFMLTKELGWLTGLILSEGSWTKNLNLCQNEGQCLDKTLYILEKYDIPYHMYRDSEKEQMRRLTLTICPYVRWIESFMGEQKSFSKALPLNYISFSNDFLDGVVAGMIDGDGTLDGYKHRHCQIRITSSVLCHQLSTYLNTKEIFVGDRTPHLYKSSKSFEQKLPLYGIGFTLTNEDYFSQIGSIKISTLYEPRIRKTGNFKNKKYSYNWGEVNIIENTEFIEDCPVVYDITTESGHFICNNVFSHNCFAYDLKDLAERGLYFIENFNAQPPQHLATFVDFVKEHCSYASNRSAGAVAYPNLIPYFYYFWKKDIESHYMGITEEYAEDFAKQQIQRLIYSLNQPFLRNSIQSAFTNTSIFDHPYFEAIFGGAIFPDGSFMIDSEEEIIEFQKIFLTEMSDIRSQNMMTFPVNTISLLTDTNGKFVDEEFAKWACEHNRKWNDSNWFIDSSVTSLSSCCRLRNDIQELGYTNSIGGAALKVGSVKVSTINLARIAYQSKNEQEFLALLRDTVETNCKILDVQRHIIQRNIEKGLLHNFDTKMIEMKYLYSSHGILGCYETMKYFGYTYEDELGNTYYKDEAYSFGRKIFKIIHAVKDTFLADKDYHMNLEAIPGETMAARFQHADEMLYPDQVVKDLPLYANQWIGLGIKTTIQERVKIAAAFSEYCSGGDILHINVDAPFDSFDKAWKMLNYVAQAGVKYFAFTGKINACENNHGFYGDICPICGKPVKTQYARIVGFFVPIQTWSQTRKQEFAMREWANVN